MPVLRVFAKTGANNKKYQKYTFYASILGFPKAANFPKNYAKAN